MFILENLICLRFRFSDVYFFLYPQCILLACLYVQ